MAFEPMILQRAHARMTRRKEIRARKRDELKRELYRKEPRLRQLDGEMRMAMADVILLSVGENPVRPDGPEIMALRDKHRKFYDQWCALVRELGHEPEELEDEPQCPLCGDTGYVGGDMCTCLRKLCTAEQIKALTALLDLREEQNFDTLSLEVYSPEPWPGAAYSPRENMGRIVTLCEGYARRFPNYPLKDLLFSGGTGLGKTFLSGCIARQVSQDGHSVVYDTAINVFSAFEAKKFSRDQEEGIRARDDTRRYLNCDLLILDDLGSELTTAMVQTALYDLVNSRLNAGRHTIISTNLSGDQITQRYTPQIASRILGKYRELTFYGEDLRTK